MTHQDEVDFIEALREMGGVKLIYNTFFDKGKMELHDLVPIGLDVYATDISILNETINPRLVHF